MECNQFKRSWVLFLRIDDFTRGEKLGLTFCCVQCTREQLNGIIQQNYLIMHINNLRRHPLVGQLVSLVFLENIVHCLNIKRIGCLPLRNTHLQTVSKSMSATGYAYSNCCYWSTSLFYLIVELSTHIAYLNSGVFFTGRLLHTSLFNTCRTGPNELIL